MVQSNAEQSARQVEQTYSTETYLGDNGPQWLIRDFSEGLVDRLEDYVLPDNASPDCLNVIATKMGSLKNRPGFDTYNASTLGGVPRAVYAYYYGANRKLMVVANGIASYHAGAGVFTSIKTGLTASATNFFETTINYLVSCNGVDAPWKWDGTTVSALANAPTTAQFFTMHKEKLFCVPLAYPSQLQWADSFEPETWPAVNYWDIKPGDGDVITAIHKHLGELIIFKKYSTHVLRGTSLDDFKMEEVDTGIGCVGQNAVGAIGPYLFFVSTSGLCVWNGMRIVNLSRDRIPVLWSTVNQQYIDKAAIGIRDNRVWVALPLSTATTNSNIIVYNPPDEGVSGGTFWKWDTVRVGCFTEYNDGTQLLFFGGSSNANNIEQLDYGNADNAGVITAYWKCKPTDLGLPDRKKKFIKAFLVDSPTAGDVSLEVSLDYNTVYTALTKESTSTDLVRNFRFPAGSYGYYMTPKITASTATGFEVRGVTIPCFPKVRMG
ncbi:MAG: hypothetical protein PHR07_04470 [Acidaminococcaceae bacterium]|nr:hypothetical protein [Acidaminococcaceae bacterium]